MNLALITQDFPPELGGIQTYSVELADRFAEKCNNFFVLAPDKPDAKNVDKKLSYPIYRISTPNPLLGIKGVPKTQKLFRKYNIDSVFHSQWQTLPISVYAEKRGLVDNIFSAVHARELVFNPFNSIPGARQLYEYYKRNMLSKVDFFFPVSTFMAHLLESHGIMKSRMNVIINGTNPDIFKPLDKQKAKKSIGIESSRILLSVSRLVSKKGIDTTLKAFSNVLAEYPDSHYVIVGEGEQYNELQALANKLNISNSVSFEGAIAHEDSKLIDYYNACDVFVMPSKTEDGNIEGCPIVFLEASACGKPVIGTFSSGIPSAVLDGETGILVEERNPALLGKAIKKLFADKELAFEMGQKGRQRIENEANWDTVADKIFNSMKSKMMG